MKKLIAVCMMVILMISSFPMRSFATEKELVKMHETSYIMDQSGRVLYEIYHGTNRKVLSYEEIPNLVKDIFILTEDKQFFDHFGLDLFGMMRAFLVNAKEKDIKQGGSTITQQLARNLYLSHERTWSRKLKEIVYALKLETTYSKEQILEMYVNNIYFHNGNYGIEAASQYYFSLSTKDLTIAQLAFICAIPNNPSLYNPLKNFDKTKSRQERIINTLHENNVITAEEYKEAKAEKIELNIKNNPITAPDYVTYVYDEIKELVAAEHGLDMIQDKDKVNEVFKEFTSQGIQIHTSLDPFIQESAVEIVNEYGLPEDVQAGVSIVNHETNTIEALVGGVNYEAFGFNRAYQAYRQPGSSIKPLLVYGPYLNETNANITDYVNSRDIAVNGKDIKNASGRSYGDTSIKQAFANSYNTTAVRLEEAIGTKTAASYLKKFGFSRTPEVENNLMAVLGGTEDEMSVLEMTRAYTTFARDGNYVKPHAIIKVTDLEGNELLTWKDESVQVWSKETNEKMRNLLQSVVDYGTAASLSVNAPYVGGKTGTTTSSRDLWFVGQTPHYTMGIWVGKDKNGDLSEIANTKPHLKIWEQIANENEAIIAP